VAVRQTGPIKVKEALGNGEDAFTEKRFGAIQTAAMSAGSGMRRIKVLCMWCGPTGSLTLTAEFDLGGGGAAVGEP